MADLGPGNDRFDGRRLLDAVDFVRINGGEGNDVIRGGPEDDLFESGPGSDHLYGGDGSDGLIGGLPGPTYLYGGGGGDLLAAGGGCAGGALVGGPGETTPPSPRSAAHPGALISLRRSTPPGSTRSPAATKSASRRSDEDIEGSFDHDVLIGDAKANVMLGQPGIDSFFGSGGNDVIVAADGVKDGTSSAAAATPASRRSRPRSTTNECPAIPAKGRPEGRALVDSIDPRPAPMRRGGPRPPRPRPPRLSHPGEGENFPTRSPW